MRFLLLIFLLSGCAAKTVQSDHILRSVPRDIPVQYEIADVPFVLQGEGDCGPATLAMAMGAAGDSVPLSELIQSTKTAQLNGTLQTDMISAARRKGYVAVPIKGLENLLREVAAGHPVIVFENLALSWLPQWHYALVYGYDLQKQSVLMHSGPEQSKVWDLRKFERSWQLADYWGLLVLPVGKLSVTANESTQVQAIAPLESLGFLNTAKISYQKILERWPQNLAAHIGLGNILYQEKEYRKSVEVLKEASRLYPREASVWHNLAFAQSALKEKIAAKHSAQTALSLASLKQKEIFQKSLQPLL